MSAEMSPLSLFRPGDCDGCPELRLKGRGDNLLVVYELPAVGVNQWPFVLEVR